MRWDDQDKPADAGAWLCTIAAATIFVTGPLIAQLALIVLGLR
jgi:hypothetical protein